MRSCWRRIHAPLMWLGFIGTAGELVGIRGVPAFWLLPLFALALAAMFAAEAGLPYEREWNRDHGDASRDLAHACVNEALNILALAAIPMLASHLPATGARLRDLPFWPQLGIAILVADAGISLAHWLSHRWRPLWQLHAVHHSVRRLYGFNGLMKHPLHQAVEASFGVAPLLLAGVSADVAAVLAFAIAVQLLLQHGNVDMRNGVLDRVFAWAPRHRYHHVRYGRAGDVNFGLFLTLWDHLLGTAFDGNRYRVTGEDLGIGSRPDYPDGYLAQLVEPFRHRREQPSPPLPDGLQRRSAEQS